jgi:hypothetical protein
MVCFCNEKVFGSIIGKTKEPVTCSHFEFDSSLAVVYEATTSCSSHFFGRQQLAVACLYKALMHVLALCIL